MSQQAVKTIAFFPLVSASKFNSFFQEENNKAVLYPPVKITELTPSFVIKD